MSAFDTAEYSAGAGGNDLGQARSGPHVSTLVGLISLGLQDGGSWQGKPKPPCDALLYIFELSDDQVDLKGDGVLTNRMFSVKAAAKSGDKAKLTKLRAALDPTNVNAANITQDIGTPVMLNLKEGDKADGSGKYIGFDSIASLHPTIPVPVIQTPMFFFDHTNPDMSVFMNSLLPWMKELIKGGLAYKGTPLEQMVLQAEAAAQAPGGTPAAQASVTHTQGTQQATAQGNVQSTVPVTQQQPVVNPGAPVVNPGQPVIANAPPIVNQVATPQVNGPVTAPAAPAGYYLDAATNTYKLIGQ